MKFLFRPLLSAFLIFAAISSVSCTKDLLNKQVRFGARTRTDVPTKTEYSYEQYTESSTLYERINWVDGDLVKIGMENGGTATYQDYSINEIQSSTNRYSVAGLLPYGADNGLQWGSGEHVFWTIYPNGGTLQFSGTDTFTASGTYPATQTQTYSTTNENVLYYEPDMSIAYMLGSLVVSEPQSSISLDYYPAMTTLDFEVGANTDVTVTGFTMETTTAQADDGLTDNLNLTGTFIATFDKSSLTNNQMAYIFSSGTDVGQQISCTFSPSAALNTTTKMRFKVFALPLDIQGVRLTFTTSLGDFSIRLKYSSTYVSDNSLTTDWIKFNACSKAEITGLLVPGAVWYIKFSGPRVEQWIEMSDVEIGVE